MDIKSIKGTTDIFAPEIFAWQTLEKEARSVFGSFGACEIRTPIFEDTALFLKSIGDTTDIVQKEMYTFLDRGDRSITLRPEGTAPIVRAYVEHHIHNLSNFTKYYYIGPMFRAERPQKGRSRQFHQIGFEAIGSKSPLCDVESILALVMFFKKIDLEGYQIKINSIGCKDDKKKFGEILKENLSNRSKELCDNCKERLNKNVLRILDCKNPGCIAIVKDMPLISENICSPCKTHFDIVKNYLTKLGINFTVTANLVRGLDYYTGTVFEITHSNLGAQDAIGAGGRYDNLVRDFGGPDGVGSFGFALGIERLIIALNKDLALPQLDIFIAHEGSEAQDMAFKITNNIRNKSLSLNRSIQIEMELENKSLNAQMRQANKKNAKYVLILNDADLKNKKNPILRDMINKTQEEVLLDNITDNLLNKI